MGRYSRDKGNAFERRIAKMIREALNISERECHRTPRSGGHYVKGDLVLDPSQRERFPFIVECKHSKRWTLSHILPVSGLMQQWLRQTYAQAAEMEGRPLLIIMGDRTPIYAIVERAPDTLDSGHVSFAWLGRRLYLVRWEEWLQWVAMHEADLA